ncbi:Uu.00g143890.m01.CDS01 [Anthostomella pinea]|uniref:cutinase n=1 Tax=Anthostomella pinea TaxID=933095 RepID=A0AAI8YLL0_9PEZI|nr:Uu.00g143890.m01.CDS01 [Anthostomella pinea]
MYFAFTYLLLGQCAMHGLTQAANPRSYDVESSNSLKKRIGESDRIAADLREILDDSGDDSLDTGSGPKECPKMAMFAARGTLDPVNMGDMVMNHFRDAVMGLYGNDKKKMKVQGVDNFDGHVYGADMEHEYLQQGGSNDGALAMAGMTDKVATNCKNTKFIWWGWSQGALVARKAFRHVSKDTADRIVVFGTFGDPVITWNDVKEVSFPAVPEHVKQLHYCLDGDALCKPGMNEVFGGFTLNPVEFAFNWQGAVDNQLETGTDGLSDTDVADLKKVAQEAVTQGMKHLPQITAEAVKLLVGNTKFWRWMLLPVHFYYHVRRVTDCAATNLKEQLEGKGLSDCKIPGLTVT